MTIGISTTAYSNKQLNSNKTSNLTYWKYTEDDKKKGEVSLVQLCRFWRSTEQGSAYSNFSLA